MVEFILVRILVSRHSAFYSPLISTIAAGFLRDEGLDASYGVLPPGRTSRDAIRLGEADVIQSAVASNFSPLEKGEKDLPLHFAQINRRDGFFLVARKGDTQFDWKHLERRSLLADHGLQPLVMLKYAARHNQVDWSRINVLDAGTPEQMAAAFREGKADYVHLQGPAAHQLQSDNVGVVTVSVGASMPEVAFSSLTASREFVESPEGRLFLRAYAKARVWARTADPAEVASVETSFFPGFTGEALTWAIAAYQRLGCWDGRTEITEDLYEQSLNVFEAAGAITRRHPFRDVVYVPAAT